MDTGTTEPQSFRVREAMPDDVADLMRLKLLLAEEENSLHAIRANADDWRRDGFGAGAGFSAFVAEDLRNVIGMATFNRRILTGWNGPVIFLQDLIVETAHRHRGVARALMAKVASLARDIGSPIVELTVHADNPAQNFYARAGFQPLPQCLTYVLAGPALEALATDDPEDAPGAELKRAG